jgi:hypothetical protein
MLLWKEENVRLDEFKLFSPGEYKSEKIILYEGLDKVERKKVLSLMQSIDSASACRDGTNDAETAEEKKMPSQKKN